MNPPAHNGETGRVGARPDGPGSQASPEAGKPSSPSGFDPSRGRRVLVCGGRGFGRVPDDTPEHLIPAARDKAAAERKWLYASLARAAPSYVIAGGATGADQWAIYWAERERVGCRVYPANWHKDGKAAGPIRNQRMLDDGKPDLVIAFPGGKGTADMVRRARAAGVTVQHEVAVG